MDTMLAVLILAVIRIVAPFGLILLLGSYLERRGMTGSHA